MKVLTRVMGFSKAEWERIRQGARAVELSGAPAATVILPGRPEVYRLERKADHFELRLSDEAELFETVRKEREPF